MVVRVGATVDAGAGTAVGTGVVKCNGSNCCIRNGTYVRTGAGSKRGIGGGTYVCNGSRSGSAGGT